MSDPRYVATICTCGCEKLEIPPHLHDADLWVSFHLRPVQLPKVIRFSYQYVGLDDGQWEAEQ